MGTSNLSNLVVFNQYVKGSMTETLQQQVELFNGATRGALTLTTKPNDGDYSEMSYWAAISNLVRRRNPYATGAVTPVELAQLRDISVKVAAGTPPVNIPPAQMRWILKDPAEQGVVYGQQLAIAMLADEVNSAIAALRAAIVQNGTTTYYDGKANNLSWLALNSGQAKFGDKASRLVCTIAHSKTVFDIWTGNLTNAQMLFRFGDVAVISDPWGRPIVMTDAPDLVKTDGISAGVPSYFTLMLVPGAASVMDNGDFDQNVTTLNGDENILRTIQSEWSFNLGLKGYQWDKTNGGHAPTSAAISTGTNWDKIATSIKDTAGVAIETK